MTNDPELAELTQAAGLGMRTFSNGGGVQSTGVLVLQAMGRVQYDAHLFANVGDDSEHPATLAYVRDIAMPYALAHGIAFHELKRRRRNGEIETLMQRIYADNRSVPIPARLANGMPAQRDCTVNFKIEVVRKWQKKHGASSKRPAITGLGISIDEFHRARTDSDVEYPLIDLRLSRRDCQRLIADAGLPMPPKSSCFFCPFHTRAAWQELKITRPDLFAKAVDIERRINEKRGLMGKDSMRLHNSNQPLDQAVGDQGAFWLEQDDNCESGYCHT